MDSQDILVIGGGIGGLTSAIALGRAGHKVTIAEKDPAWAVYGVGIIQQANVVRAVAQLGIIDDYIDAGFGFDFVEVYLPDGARVARIPVQRLVEGYPANVGIGRPALHQVLGDHAKKAGAEVRLGIQVESIAQDADGVDVLFSDGSEGRFDLVIGADGLYSRTRRQLFPDAPGPAFTGQSVWRYNLPKPPEIDCLSAYEGPRGVGLTPLSRDLMYMFLTTAEPGNPRFPTEGLAAEMRSRITVPAPQIQQLVPSITDDEEVVYKPLEWLLLEGDWHKGRVVLLGDAVHGTTPHLGQGAGMAIEDSIVLAEEIGHAAAPAEAFAAWQARRQDRCRYIVETSLSICRGQLGLGPRVDQAKATQEMFVRTAQPI